MIHDLNGTVERGWEPVADAFRLSQGGTDHGAGLCVYVDGRPVVDLWTGLADRTTGRLWQRDTPQLVASPTKGATAICAHMLVERGQLDLDAPVTRYWPEFGQAGKEEVLVRHLLSHQAGLPYVEPDVSFEESCQWSPMIEALERQRPLWASGTEHIYHAMTYGFLVGEVIRRITGKSVGRFFAEEVAGPLGLDAWIGLPAEIEPLLARMETEPFPVDRMQELVADFARTMQMSPEVIGQLMVHVYGPGTAFMRAGQAGGVTPENMFSRAYRAAEFPGANMVASAHAVARMYAATVSDVDGIRLLNRETVGRATALQTNRSHMHGVAGDLLPHTENLFNMSLGFWRSTPPVHPLLGPASFGHPGSGGSLGAADPDRRVGFGYVPNFWPAAMIDPRAPALCAAVRECLEGA